MPGHWFLVSCTHYAVFNYMDAVPNVILHVWSNQEWMQPTSTPAMFRLLQDAPLPSAVSSISQKITHSHQVAAATDPLTLLIPLWSFVGAGAWGCTATKNVPSPLASWGPLRNTSFFQHLCLGLTKLSCCIVAELIKLWSPSSNPSSPTACNTQFVG